MDFKKSSAKSSVLLHNLPEARIICHVFLIPSCKLKEVKKAWNNHLLLISLDGGQNAFFSVYSISQENIYVGNTKISKNIHDTYF